MYLILMFFSELLSARRPTNLAAASRSACVVFKLLFKIYKKNFDN